MQKKNKAFTLTELLVVVIVLGVLAAVAVPKFTRVLETRKTTEAEEIFAAVRTEQENRCVFGKNYLTDKTQLSMLSGADNSGSYAYSLTGQGIVASSDKGYQLKMPSYKDGQICCEGAYCDSLNKSYPSCSAISVSADECVGEAVEPEPDPVKTCDEGSKPVASQACGNCGTQTRSVTCDTNTGVWQSGAWSGCAGQGVCTPGSMYQDTSQCETGFVQMGCTSSCQWTEVHRNACCNSSRKLVDSFDISYPRAEKQTNSCGRYFTADNRFVCSYADKGKTCNEYVMSTQTVESEKTTRTVTGTWSSSSGCCNRRNGSCPPTSTCSSSIKYTSSNGQIVGLPDANDACQIQCPSGRCGYNDGLSTSCRISTSSTVDRCTPHTWDGTELGRVFKYSVATLNCRVQTSTQPVKKTKYHLDVYEVTCCE